MQLKIFEINSIFSDKTANVVFANPLSQTGLSPQRRSPFRSVSEILKDRPDVIRESPGHFARIISEANSIRSSKDRPWDM